MNGRMQMSAAGCRRHWDARDTVSCPGQQLMSAVQLMVS